MRNAWAVYILRCNDDTLYTGITNNLEKRIIAHAAGKGSKYTRSRLPVELVYHEPAENRSEATRRELEIKGLSRGNKMKMMKVSCLSNENT